MIFQSTGPLRDPTVTDGNIYTVSFISIHRSLAGPDYKFGYRNMDTPEFQSTGPLRDPT